MPTGAVSSHCGFQTVSRHVKKVRRTQKHIFKMQKRIFTKRERVRALPKGSALTRYFTALSAKVLLTTLSNGAGEESSPASAITFCSNVKDASDITGVSQKAPIF